MSTTALFQAWREFSLAHPALQQFGQSDDESTWNGATGCTQTILQRLILAKTGTRYSHDEISRIASYPWPAQNPNRRGMYSGGSDNEVGRVMAKFGLPYKLMSSTSYQTWRPWLPNAANERGPVMLGILYGWWPEKPGFHYGDTVSNGSPNGYASIGGKTQLTGAESVYHMILAWGARKDPDRRTTYFAYTNEPNHGSGSRPETPAYDRTTTGQLARAYLAYAHDGRPRLAWVPTTTFRPKGF